MAEKAKEEPLAGEQSPKESAKDPTDGVIEFVQQLEDYTPTVSGME